MAKKKQKPEVEQDPMSDFMTEGAGEFTGPTTTGDEDQPARNSSIDQMTDVKNLRTWMLLTAKLSIEELDTLMVKKSYTAAIWFFRQAALTGDIRGTKALETWINWAKPIIGRAKEKRNVTPSKGSVAFLPREPGRDESE